jgi:hypothetical protein
MAAPSAYADCGFYCVMQLVAWNWKKYYCPARFSRLVRDTVVSILLAQVETNVVARVLGFV